MNKIKLDLDHLAVESFPTESTPPKEAGTVHGHTGQLQTRCSGYTCGLHEECWVTVEFSTGCTCDCTGVADPTCDVTCSPTLILPTCAGDTNCG